MEKHNLTSSEIYDLGNLKALLVEFEKNRSQSFVSIPITKRTLYGTAKQLQIAKSIS
jgi:hypothetical protein